MKMNKEKQTHLAQFGCYFHIFNTATNQEKINTETPSNLSSGKPNVESSRREEVKDAAKADRIGLHSGQG